MSSAQNDSAPTTETQAQRHHAAILDSAGEGIYGIDQHGRITFANRAACRMLGRSRAELVGQHSHRLFHGHFRDGTVYPEHVCPATLTLDDGLPRTVEQDWFELADGAWLPVRLTITPLFEGQQQSGAVVVFNDLTPQLLSERQRRLQTQRQEGLIEAMGEGLIMHDTHGRITRVNPAAERMFGYHAADVLGHPIPFPGLGQLLSDDGRPFPLPQLPHLRARVTGRAVTDVVIGIRADDQAPTRWYKVSAVPLPDERDAQGHAVVVTTSEITHLKALELSLREGRERLQLALEASHAGSFYYDFVHDTNLWDPRTLEIFGLSEAEFGHDYASWANCVHPDDLPLVEQQLRDCIAAQSLFDTQFRILRPDGELRYIGGQSSITFASDGTPLTLNGLLFDITAETLAQRREQLNARRLDALLDLSRHANEQEEAQLLQGGLAIAQAICDSPGGYLLLFDAQQQTLHPGAWSATLDDAFAPLRQRPLPLAEAGAWADCARLGTLQLHDDYRSPEHSPAGSLSPRFQRHLCCPVEEAGAVCMLLGVVDKAESYSNLDQQQLTLVAQDLWKIIARRRTELELVEARYMADQANRAKSAFLANMSHELRTPLNAVIGYTQILQQDPLLGPTQQHSLAAIRRAGDYLLLLINDILDLAKIEAGHFELLPAPVNLRPFFDQLAEPFAQRAQQKGLQFTLALADALPLGVELDERRLRQILLNLLSNALKFTEQGAITLGVSYAEGHLQVRVEDTGVGIPPARMAELFTPYAQISEQAYQREGSGLGLTISHSLVAQMGGELTVESHPGTGSGFGFQIPAPQVAEVGSQPRHPGRVEKIHGYRRRDDPLTPLRLLVVDDNEDNRVILRGMLAPLGFQLDEATGGEAALTQVERLRPDLVLMDLVMPGLDGLEASRRLHQRDPDLPIVALSARAAPEDREASRAAGCVAHIARPMTFETLCAVLEAHLPLEWQGDEVITGAEGEVAAQDAWLAAQLGTLAASQRADLRRMVLHGSRREVDHYLIGIAAEAELRTRLLTLLDDFQHQHLLDLLTP